MIKGFNAALREEARKELARRNYLDYCKYVNGDTWIVGKHIKLICDKVEELIERKIPQNILILSIPPQHGKLCSDDTLVLTPNGYVKHGDLAIGDIVYGRYGEPVKVLNILNEGNMANYEVKFTDGEKIKVHGQHEWVVHDRNLHKEIKLETEQMFNTDYFKGGRCRYQVDANKAIEFSEKKYDVEPYVLGLWLGDGTTTKPSITHHKDDIEPINKIKSYGYEPSNIQVHKDTGVITTSFYGELGNRFKKIGFANPKGIKKHIPKEYKLGSIKQRLELLAGIIDSDGYVYQKNGRVTISNINKKLIYDLKDICISLGFRTTISEFKPIKSSSGIVGKNVVYQLTFNPDLEIPTALPRKKTRITTPMKRKRGIISIKPIKPIRGKCITVEGGIYLVGRNLIPTHNSQAVSETLPSYYLGKYPQRRVIEISYGDDLAVRFGKRNKAKIKQFGKELFGIELDPASQSNTDFSINYATGGMISRGIMAGLTGNPGDLIIIDDPIKNRQEAESQLTRDRIWSEFLDSIYSRLSAKGVIILIMTRWHEDDLAGKILAEMPEKCLEINIPLEAEENDILGRKPGDALFPEIGKNNEWLKSFKRVYMSNEGKRSWNALYQGRPNSATGNLIPIGDFQYYDVLPSRFDQVLQSWDCTFKDSDGTDYVVGQVWGRVGPNKYLIDMVRARMDFAETIKAILGLTLKHPDAYMKLIEDKANGPAIISTLNGKVEGICPINPEGSKLARVQSILPQIECKNVYLPKFAPWLDVFIDECRKFPLGTHDDMVDAMSQALNKMKLNYVLPVVKEKKKLPFALDTGDDNYFNNEGGFMTW